MSGTLDKAREFTGDNYRRVAGLPTAAEAEAAAQEAADKAAEEAAAKESEP